MSFVNNNNKVFTKQTFEESNLFIHLKQYISITSILLLKVTFKWTYFKNNKENFHKDLDINKISVYFFNFNENIYKYSRVIKNIS